jgi:chromosome segregation ATPase
MISGLQLELEERGVAVATTQKALDSLSQEIRDTKQEQRRVNAAAADNETMTTLREKHEQLQREVGGALWRGPPHSPLRSPGSGLASGLWIF